MKEWLTEQFNRRIRSQALEKINTYSQKAKETAWQPVDYYRKQEALYRGLFWLAVALLIVLWIKWGPEKFCLKL